MYAHMFTVAAVVLLGASNLAIAVFAPRQTYMIDQLQTPTSLSQTTQPPASIFSAESITASSESSWLNSTTQHPGACVEDCTAQIVQSRKYSWAKCEGTTYVGIINVVIDKATNQTKTSTSSYQDQFTYFSSQTQVTAALSDILSNGGVSILTRTDVNAAGTVTQVVTGHETPFNVVTYTYPTARVYVEPQYQWNGTLPYTQDGTTTCVQAASGTTATIPSISNFPTLATQQLDLDDEAGWTYCYQDSADSVPVNQSFYTLFDGIDDIFVAVSNSSNCDQVPQPVVGPVTAVAQVSFLFEQTTSYINDPGATKTSIAPSNSDRLAKSPVLVDPFELTTQSTSTETPLQSSTSNANVALPVTYETTSSEKPSILETNTDSPAKTTATTSSTPPVNSDNNEEPVTSHNQPTKSKDPNAKSTSPPLVTSNPEIESNGGSPASATLGILSLGNLNSLISVVAADQSSSLTSQKAPDANSAGLPQHISTLDTTITTSLDGAGPVAVGSHITGPEEPAHQYEGVTHAADTNGGGSTVEEASTHLGTHTQVTYGVSSVLTFGDAIATVNAATEYVFGDQTLKPGSSAIVISGTSISLVQGATAVIIGAGTDIPTSANTPQALTVGGVVVTAVPIGTKTTSLDKSNTAPRLITDDATGVTTAIPSAATQYVVGGQTVRPGAPAITVSGTCVSLATDATVLVVGTESKNLQATTVVGDYIWAGIAGVLSDAQTSSTPASESIDASTASDGSAASWTALDSSSTSSDVFQGSSSGDAASSTQATGPSDLFTSSSSSSSSQSSSVTEFASEATSQHRITTAIILLAIIVFYLYL